jgi:hypothetical protein
LLLLLLLLLRLLLGGPAAGMLRGTGRCRIRTGTNTGRRHHADHALVLVLELRRCRRI